MLKRYSKRRLFAASLILAAACSQSYLLGAGSYSLRGQTTIGDTTYLAIQEGTNGRTRLLEVGDNENRTVYVSNWNPETREAIVIANGQRFTLQMEQPVLDDMPVSAVLPTNPTQQPAVIGGNHTSPDQRDIPVIEQRPSSPRVVGNNSTNSTDTRQANNNNNPRQTGENSNNRSARNSGNNGLTFASRPSNNDNSAQSSNRANVVGSGSINVQPNQDTEEESETDDQRPRRRRLISDRNSN